MFKELLPLVKYIAIYQIDFRALKRKTSLLDRSKVYLSFIQCYVSYTVLEHKLSLSLSIEHNTHTLSHSDRQPCILTKSLFQSYISFVGSIKNHTQVYTCINTYHTIYHMFTHQVL